MSFTSSKIITSSQTGIHANLEKVVRKHLAFGYQKPIAEYTQVAFAEMKSRWQELSQPKLILDSACGTGESTRHFAQTYKDCLVVGLDQSAKRLSHTDNIDLPENCLLLRCDCTDFWRLAAESEIRFEKHFLLYPNPYPKPQHLQRRWQGHPAFSSLIAISPYIELRSNWKIYAQEFFAALQVAKLPANINQYRDENTITAFERKYKASAHDLWQVCSDNTVC